MVEIAIASLARIQATLNHAVPTHEKLVSYAYEPPAGIPMSTVQVEGHATTIHDFRPTLRRRVGGKNDRSALVPRQPANLVNVDQTATSGAARLRAEYPHEANDLLRRRVAVVNLWRPTKSPGFDAPLAVCDARSVTPKNLLASELVYPDRRGETYNLVFDPNQRCSMREKCAETKSGVQMLGFGR